MRIFLGFFLLLISIFCPLLANESFDFDQKCIEKEEYKKRSKTEKEQEFDETQRVINGIQNASIQEIELRDYANGIVMLYLKGEVVKKFDDNFYKKIFNYELKKLSEEDKKKCQDEIYSRALREGFESLDKSSVFTIKHENKELDSDILIEHTRDAQNMIIYGKGIFLIPIKIHSSIKPNSEYTFCLGYTNCKTETLVKWKDGNTELTTPTIKKIAPNGGITGSNIEVIGDFGTKDIQDIQIEFYTKESKEGLNVSRYQNAFRGHFLHRMKPQYLGDFTDLSIQKESGLQKIEFYIPDFGQTNGGSDSKTTANGIFYDKVIYFIIYSKNVPSIEQRISMLHPKWREKAFGISFFMVSLLFLFLICSFYYFKKEIPFIKDNDLNVYNINKLLAVVWTFALVGSYCYACIVTFVTLKKYVLPDFNMSLFWLMGISYSGTSITNTILKVSNKNKLRNKAAKPSILDFVKDSEGNYEFFNIQLVLFNAIVLVAYTINLYAADILNGLPDIPASLNVLLGGSQGGYILGKLGNSFGPKKKLEFIQVQPNEILSNAAQTKIKVLGGGFDPGIKVIINGKDFATPTLVESNLIEITLETIPDADYISISCISSLGESLEAPNAIKIIKPTPQNPA